VASIVTALIPVLTRKKPPQRPPPSPSPWLLFLSIAGLGIAITTLGVAFLHGQRGDLAVIAKGGGDQPN
jgi:drug/metabolite transporter (DMT)-like permease